MGQKVHPTSLRLGNIFTWTSRWFANKKNYAQQVLEDYKLRELLDQQLANAGLITVTIERSITKIKITLLVSRPGVVIGKGGKNLELVKKKIERILQSHVVDKNKTRVDLRVEEFKEANLSAKLVAQRIATQLMGRYPHRRAVSQALENVMGAGAKGVKIQLSGRIAGAEIGRTEKYFRGSVPTQTIRANIDYYESPAKTRSGYVGIKVWIYKGEIV